MTATTFSVRGARLITVGAAALVSCAVAGRVDAGALRVDAVETCSPPDDANTGFTDAQRGRPECSVEIIDPGPPTSDPVPLPDSFPAMEAWPVDAFVIEYVYSEPAAEPGDATAVVLSAGRVGAGIPSVEVAVRFAGTDDYQQFGGRLDDEAWNSALVALLTDGIGGDGADCVAATQIVTVRFGGDDLARSCAEGSEPPTSWLGFLEPLVEDLPGIEVPDEIPDETTPVDTTVGPIAGPDGVVTVTYSASNQSLPPDRAWAYSLEVTTNSDGTASARLTHEVDGADVTTVRTVDAETWTAITAELVGIETTTADCAPGSSTSSLVVEFAVAGVVDVAGCGASIEGTDTPLEAILADFDL